MGCYSLKDEFNLDDTFDNFEQAEEKVRISIEVYNMQRPHLSLNYKTPSAVHFEKDENYKYNYKISRYENGKSDIIVSDKQNYYITINSSRTSPSGFS